MPTPIIRFVSAILLVAAGLAGCGVEQQPGWRQLIVTVENLSPRPATLVVAEDWVPMKEPIGTAEPGVVSPGATMDVTLGVPPGQGWAVFVNPETGQGGLLVMGHDVPPDASGRAEFGVYIDKLGQVTVGNPDGFPPGWFDR